jgi:hypothetical protein
LAALLKTILSRLREYVSNPDPMAKAAGTVAVVVATLTAFIVFAAILSERGVRSP